LRWYYRCVCVRVARSLTPLAFRQRRRRFSDRHRPIAGGITVAQVASLLAWVAVLVAEGLLLWHSWLARAVFLAVYLFFFAVTKVKGGLVVLPQPQPSHATPPNNGSTRTCALLLVVLSVIYNVDTRTIAPSYPNPPTGTPDACCECACGVVVVGTPYSPARRGETRPWRRRTSRGLQPKRTCCSVGWWRRRPCCIRPAPSAVSSAPRSRVLRRCGAAHVYLEDAYEHATKRKTQTCTIS
jgi:hypothetical protein